MASRGQELRWVLRAQSGDAAALNALLESIQEPLYGYILGLVRDPTARKTPSRMCSSW